MTEVSPVKKYFDISSNILKSNINQSYFQRNNDENGGINFGRFLRDGQNFPGDPAFSSTLPSFSLKRIAQSEQVDTSRDRLLSMTGIKPYKHSQIAAAAAALLDLQEEVENCSCQIPEGSPMSDTEINSKGYLGIDLSRLLPDEQNEVKAELDRFQADMAEAQGLMSDLAATLETGDASPAIMPADPVIATSA